MRILDYGGGDGLYTANLLARLKSNGVSFESLLMTDPCDWEAEYRKTVSPIVGRAPLSVFNARTPSEIPEPVPFDLIVASHSLYALLDSRRGDENPIDELVRRLRPGGAMVVVLSSTYSHAYRFRAQALRSLFGIDPNDVVGEDVLPGQRHAPRLDVADFRYEDSLIDVTTVASAPEGSNQATEWLSYFLRVNLEGAPNRSLRREVLAILERQVMLARSLPPGIVQRSHEFVALRSVDPESTLLLHKTLSLLWTKPEAASPSGALDLTASTL